MIETIFLIFEKDQQDQIDYVNLWKRLIRSFPRSNRFFDHKKWSLQSKKEIVVMFLTVSPPLLCHWSFWKIDVINSISSIFKNDLRDELESIMLIFEKDRWDQFDLFQDWINLSITKKDRFDQKKSFFVSFWQFSPFLCQKIDSLLPIFDLFKRSMGSIQFHQSLKKIYVIKLIKSIFEKERPWLNRSSWSLKKIDSILKIKLITKNDWFYRKTDDRIPNPEK